MIKLAVLLEMIKFKFTVFALPFALTGAFLAARGLPRVMIFFWIVVAMVGARTSAMAFNRIADKSFDGDNPRTSHRALPSEAVSAKAAWGLTLGAALLFFFAAWQLNPLALKVSPFALALIWGYSYTKRFTTCCHLILGLCLAIAPLGGWVAVSGNLSNYPWVLSLGVVFWVAGFDIIYSCLDSGYDRKAGLFSLPSRLGAPRALRLAAVFHLLAIVFFILAGWACHLHWLYYLLLLAAAAALWYQHHIVKADDLSRVHLAFQAINSAISVVIFFAVWLALAVA
ncbi:MAG: putative 4-hydroxybenzoate polyprenyltransferase [Desulfobulbaceae bacterium]|jgi:4-hydroxybenzoate polyprenyltransferase|nr:putative 4-hydroxybenzoate polyprenyltransferase [Desulfobulbaceae bacterium]